MKSENPLRDWLNSVASDSTRKLYQHKFKVFLTYLYPELKDEKLSIDERAQKFESYAKTLLQLRREEIKDPDSEGDMGRVLKRFYVDLLAGHVERLPWLRLYKGKKPKRKISKMKKNWVYKPKAGWAFVSATCQFFRFFGKAYEVTVRVTEQQLKVRTFKRKYEFSTEELQRILAIAGIRDKCLTLLGATAGWGSSDIANLKRDTVEKILNDQQGKYFGFSKRIKTNTDQFLCLTSETRQSLKAYIKTLPQNETWLFPGYNGKQGHLDAGRLDVILKALAQKAGIESKDPALKPVRFHGLRQYFSRKYRGRSEVREICMGHFQKYDGAYNVTEEEIWEDFQTQDENLRIQQTNGNQLKAQLSNLQTQMQAKDTEIVNLRQGFNTLVSTLYADGKLNSSQVASMAAAGYIKGMPFIDTTPIAEAQKEEVATAKTERKKTVKSQ